MNLEACSIGLCIMMAAVLVAPARAAEHTIDAAVPGVVVSPWIRGQNVATIGSADQEQFYNKWALEVSRGSSSRGVAGGLYAETYNWKDRTGFGVGSNGYAGRPTLEFLREARDFELEQFITVNMRATGVVNPAFSTWTPTNNSVTHLAQLAADWVRYTNHIVPTYRQGDTITDARDAAIVASLQWDRRTSDTTWDPNYDRLLAPGEAAVKAVRYWEIGNEPELPFASVPALSGTDFLGRYKAIAAAMKAEDPTIRVGPALLAEPTPSLQALMSDPTAPVDFISYHPYHFPDYSSAATAEATLRGVKAWQVGRHQVITDAIEVRRQHQPGFNPEIVASEYNASNWTSINQPSMRTVAHALGNAETVFTHAELGLKASHFWMWLSQAGDSAWTELPVRKVYEAFQNHLGDRLLDSYVDGDIRLYTTYDTSKNELVVWGLNFSDTVSETIELSLANIVDADEVSLMRLFNRYSPTGDTSLLDSNPIGLSNQIGWETEVLSGFDFASYGYTIDDATMTALVIRNPTFVPEPGTLALATAFGIAGLLRRTRRLLKTHPAGDSSCNAARLLR